MMDTGSIPPQVLYTGQIGIFCGYFRSFSEDRSQAPPPRTSCSYYSTSPSVRKEVKAPLHARVDGHAIGCTRHDSSCGKRRYPHDVSPTSGHALKSHIVPRMGLEVTRVFQLRMAFQRGYKYISFPVECKLCRWSLVRA